MNFQKDILKLDCEAEINRICSFIKEQMLELKRDGIVIGISGGIDSALSCSLSVRAVGKEKVLGLILPEKESNPISAEYALKHTRQLGIKTEIVNITPVLEAFGTYERRDSIVKALIPEYDKDCKLKITLPPDILLKDAFNFFTLKVDDGKGNVKTARLDNKSLRGIVAATDTKQRTRMLNLYYYAEEYNLLVCGTTNRSEAIQGLFVKYGDGGVDVEPIVHLYKTQVYQLAEYLSVIREIMDRTPSPDTFSYTVSDEEFYFRMPYDKLDLLLYAWENKIDISIVCEVMRLSEEQVKRVFRDFNSKYNATKHLRKPIPQLPDSGVK